MDIAAVGKASSRLLEALEKLSSSPGADLKSATGPSGQPDPELVRAFLDALEGTSGASSGLQGGAGGQGLSDPTALSDDGPGGLPLHGGPEAMPGVAPDIGPEAASGIGSDTRPDATGMPDETGATGKTGATYHVDDAARRAGVQEMGPGETSPPSPGEFTASREPATVPTSSGEQPSTVSARASSPDAAPSSQGADRPHAPDGVRTSSEVPGTGHESGAGRGASGADDPLRELARLVERVATGQPTPTELYRLQYMVGMLRLQASSGTQVSQQATQGLESLLKQQG
ncbi:hypothetical protein [Nitratidesulfovibrio vulgaris]|uniref:Uncharacterized protein n=1 Tax=Nitratidesulfovibrio vulgaris (strain DP4) TaxID=391774 RepID=A0A0H3AC69_NITV4|nr:hypothetical protein [Nitratidesulfovibrio vulgaris]ABM30003.1 hypothetical protein Dvul_2992 [Nitratidesulfovibrio vulgaris DP4]